jgi:thiamine biosynthesis protein ThiS
MSPVNAQQAQPLDVVVNGRPRSLPAGSTLADLVAALGLAERRFAVSVNRDVVPRSGLAARVLGAGDRVEILEAVGGG